MRTFKYLLTISVLSVLYGCSSSRYVAHDPNIGKIEIEIFVETGKDSLARTPDGNVIGKIDKNGFIYDMLGNKIGKRKPTIEEVIQQSGVY